MFTEGASPAAAGESLRFKTEGAHRNGVRLDFLMGRLKHKGASDEFSGRSEVHRER